MGDKLKIEASASHLQGDYGIDGWRLADLNDGHIIDLRVGHGFMIYALTLWDGHPDDWRLIQIDCAVAEVDIEVKQENTVWQCKKTTLSAPDDGPPLRLLEANFRGEYKVSHATIEANTPRTYEFNVFLKDNGYQLQYTQDGHWKLLDETSRLLKEAPAFSTGFNVYFCSNKPKWRADDTVKLVELD